MKSPWVLSSRRPLNQGPIGPASDPKDFLPVRTHNTGKPENKGPGPENSCAACNECKGFFILYQHGFVKIPGEKTVKSNYILLPQDNTYYQYRCLPLRGQDKYNISLPEKPFFNVSLESLARCHFFWRLAPIAIQSHDFFRYRTPWGECVKNKDFHGRKYPLLFQ